MARLMNEEEQKSLIKRVNYRVDARQALSDYTLNVHVKVVNLRWVKMRLWIALKLCRLAAFIGGIGLEINEDVGVLVTDLPGKEIQKSDYG